MSKTTLLKVGALITSAESHWNEPAYILMRDGRIVETGRGDYPGDVDEFNVIDRSRRVAMPGLVNSHGHAAMTLLRGIGDDLPLQTWLEERVFPAEGKLTHDAVYWGTLLAAWEMLRSGTTCFTDMYFFMHDAAKAVEESGIRGVLSWGLVGFDAEHGRQGLENTRAFAKTWNHSAKGRITVTMGPHAPYTCPDAYLHEVMALADELALPIQIHLSETKLEVDNSLSEFGMSPIERMARIGMFERPTLAAHCVHVSDHDISLMQRNDVRVAHNPQSNLKLASGVAPVTRMLAAGLTVGLGTDGAASNNNLDMFEELRLAATLHKGVTLDPLAIPAAQALDMATAGSARSVFLPDGHGTLTLGSAADITLLDLNSSHFLPNFDLLSNVVYAAGAGDVTDVFVAGQHVLSNREPLTIDTERVAFEVTRLQFMLQG